MPHPAIQTCANCLYYCPHGTEGEGECRPKAPEVVKGEWGYATVPADFWCGGWHAAPVDNGGRVVIDLPLVKGGA